jgi:LemA protein
MEFLVILGVVAAIFVFFVMLYNRLVALRQNRSNAFSDIDVQLKLRFDLVPSLVETVKGYAAHEKSVFEAVTNARAGITQSQGTEARISAEQKLSGALANMYAVAENYPALKADQNFQNLQSELSDIENKIAAARRFFNNATGELNTAVQQFPANLIAAKFGFHTEGFFEDSTDRATLEKAPSVKF